MITTAIAHIAARSIVAGALVASGALGASAVASQGSAQRADPPAVQHQAANGTAGAGFGVTLPAGSHAADPQGDATGARGNPGASPVAGRAAMPDPTHHPEASATHRATVQTMRATATQTMRTSAASATTRPVSAPCADGAGRQPGSGTGHDGMGHH